MESLAVADSSNVSLLSNDLIRGFGSKAPGAGPERRLTGTALSARLSTKSRTMKSLLEKSSREKLGPLGKRLFGPELDRSMVGQPGVEGIWIGYM